MVVQPLTSGTLNCTLQGIPKNIESQRVSMFKLALCFVFELLMVWLGLVNLNKPTNMLNSNFKPSRVDKLSDIHSELVALHNITPIQKSNCCKTFQNKIPASRKKGGRKFLGLLETCQRQPHETRIF